MILLLICLRYYFHHANTQFPFLSNNFLIFFILFPFRLKKGLNLTNITSQSEAILNTYLLHYFTPVIFLQDNILLYAIFSFMLNCLFQARSSVHFFFYENVVVTDFYRTTIALTLRRLMSYIYIYGAPILDVSRSHTTTQHSR